MANASVCAYLWHKWLIHLLVDHINLALNMSLNFDYKNTSF